MHVREAVLTLGCMPTLMASGLLGFMVASHGNSPLSKSFCLFLWASIRNSRFITTYFFLCRSHSISSADHKKIVEAIETVKYSSYSPSMCAEE